MKGETMSNVENGVTPVQTRQSEIGAETVTGCESICSGAAAMPRRARIDGMTVRVVSGELQAVAELFSDRDLQTVIS